MKTSVLLLALASRAAALELTKEDWDEKTAGKTVFVKFLAPWWGHCKKLKPDWDKLMSEYEGHQSILIADVDCTTGGKSLCNEVGVQGYPSIKYGDPSGLEDYEGGRSLSALKKFAEENLGPKCGPDNMDLCDADKKAEIEELLKLPAEEVKKQVDEKEAELKAADEELETLLKSLQAQYEEGQKKAEATKEAVKASGLNLLKKVKAFKSKSKAEL